ncbi:hypothetical protein COCNU_07G008030 [Cocos nucifera]|uniref:Uncharacterized protein n=1 Tax=Cocos nucifera TaxID=13894 RepID=A0A8K0IEP9_COCNU|nr:hypothetical protein COCNU_07G008030 [Cocos nucifera]
MAATIAVATKVFSSLGVGSRGGNKFHRRFHEYEVMQRKSRPRMRFFLPSPSCPPRALHDGRNARVEAAETEKSPSATPEGDDDSSYSVLTCMTSTHNNIVVVDTPKSRFLLLDSSHNIHSMLNKDQIWTGSYWDEFASLPAIVPQGPIAILGLGGGTAAHLLLKLWPSLHLEGWEIDEILIDMAREYFGLSELEKSTQAGGSLSVHLGDALSESATVEGGFAGIIVDLFCDGKILPQLKEVKTWLEIERKLMLHGRIMVNCGGAHSKVSGSGDKTAELILSTDSWVQNSAIKALCQAFPGKLSWKRMAEKDSDNYLALTGPLPDLDAWSAALPSQLSLNVKQWRPCELAC